jgi:hypothetical protein
MERKSKLKLLTGAVVLMVLLSGCGGNSGSGNTGDAGNAGNVAAEGQSTDDYSTQNAAGTEGTADPVTSENTDQSVIADGNGTDVAAVDENGTTDTSATSVTTETETKTPAPVSSPSPANTATKPSSSTTSGTKTTTNTDKAAVSSPSPANTATKSSSGTASETTSTTNTDTTQAKTVMAKIVKISSSSITVQESTQSPSAMPGGARGGGVKPTPQATDATTGSGTTTDTTTNSADGTAQPGRMGGGRVMTFSDTQTTYSVSSTTVVSAMEAGAETSIKITDLAADDIVTIELSSDKKSVTHITKRPSPQAAGNK